MTLIIERTTEGDLEPVAALFDAYRVFYEQPSDLRRAREFLAERLARKDSVLFHARNEQGDIVGFTQLYPFFSSVHTRRLWVLNDLFVRPQERGRGVGKALLDHARDHAVDTGARGILLETGVTNVGAQRLYESLGYRREDEVFHYFLPVARRTP